jgi:Replication-relaxation
VSAVPDPQYEPERTPFELWEGVDGDVPEMRSRAREMIGIPVVDSSWDDVDDEDDGEWEEPVEPPRPVSLLELDRYDRIVSIAEPPLPIPASKRVALRRVRYEHLAVIRWLDRFGCMTTWQLHQAVMADAKLRSAQMLLAAMRRAGLVHCRRTQLRIEHGRGRGGSAPRIWQLTSTGYRLGQHSHGFVEPVIPRDRPLRRSEHETPMRLEHDLHGVSWWLAFRATVDRRRVGIRDVFTPRSEQGKFAVPHVHIAYGRGSRPVQLRDVVLADQATFNGIPNEPFTRRIEPDLTIRLSFDADDHDLHEDLEVDLLVEIDRSQRPSYNRDKLARYDAFLTGWGLLHPRVKELGTRPVVVFVSRDPAGMGALMKLADQVMTGRIGRLGDPDYRWYWAAREHTFFTTEEEAHNHTLDAWQLPECPRTNVLDEPFRFRRVTLPRPRADPLRSRLRCRPPTIAPNHPAVLLPATT